MDERERQKRIRDGTMPLIFPEYASPYMVDRYLGWKYREESGTPSHFIKPLPPHLLNPEQFFLGIHIHEPNENATNCGVCKKMALENRISRSKWI